MRKPFDILLVEDHTPDAEHLRVLFKSIPVINTVVNFENHASAFKYLSDDANTNIGLVIVDYYNLQRKHEDYLEILDHCNKRGLPCIVLTSNNDVMQSVEAIHHGAWLYLQKPIVKKDIINIVDAVDDFALEIVNTRELRDAM